MGRPGSSWRALPEGQKPPWDAGGRGTSGRGTFLWVSVCVVFLSHERALLFHLFLAVLCLHRGLAAPWLVGA